MNSSLTLQIFLDRMPLAMCGIVYEMALNGSTITKNNVKFCK